MPGDSGSPNNYGEMREKINNRRVPHIYELFFKIGCICSDFRNENFKEFQGFFLLTPLHFVQPSRDSPNILPSYGTDIREPVSHTSHVSYKDQKILYWQDVLVLAFAKTPKMHLFYTFSPQVGVFDQY